MQSVWRFLLRYLLLPALRCSWKRPEPGCGSLLWQVWRWDWLESPYAFWCIVSAFCRFYLGLSCRICQGPWRPYPWLLGGRIWNPGSCLRPHSWFSGFLHFPLRRALPACPGVCSYSWFQSYFLSGPRKARFSFYFSPESVPVCPVGDWLVSLPARRWTG